MTKLPPSSSMNKALEQLLSGATDTDDLIGELLRRGTAAILQAGLEGEVTDFLGRDRYERRADDAPTGYRNGYRRRRLKTRAGTVQIEEPRTRDTETSFESAILARLDRVEERLEKMALEMYARGLSTRDIEATLTDEAGQPLLSRSSMSRLSEELYEEYEAFATRDLSGLDVVYLFLDGAYEAVRHYTLNQAILCAWGILSDGTKQMIHLEAVGSESRDAWGSFLEGLLARGMPHPLLVTTDGGKGVIAALNKHLPRSKRQRCVVHKLRNIAARAPRDLRQQFLEEAKAVYYAPNRDAAETLAETFISTHASSYPSVVKTFSEDLEACLTLMEFPLAHRKSIRSTNLIERAFVEQKRRTKVIPTHVNERGAIKLVFASLIRASYAWRRVKMTNLDLAQLRTLRALMCPNEPESPTISFRPAA